MLQDVIQPPTPDEQLPIVIPSSLLHNHIRVYLVLMHVLELS